MSLSAIADALEAAAAELRRHAAADTDTLPLPLENAGWVEWSGGEQPPETYGKWVDIQLHDGFSTDGHDSATIVWLHAAPGTREADANVVRYRISAEQPAT